MSLQRRRAFLVGLCALLVTRSYARTRVYRLALLSGGIRDQGTQFVGALLERLAELGYREHQNLSLELRYADGQWERLPDLAAQLVALRPDVIVAVTSPSARAVFNATRTIPIVFTAVSNPVGLGIVKSLARPGTNATGVSGQNSELHGKRLQTLKELLPNARQVVVLYDPMNTAETVIVNSLVAPAMRLGLTLRPMPTSSTEDFDRARGVLEANPPDALYVIEGTFSFSHRDRIVTMANKLRVPGVYGLAEMVAAGGLVSYNMSLLDQLRAAAPYIDKIFRGARPGDLPVEQPTKFYLVINLKTANALGLTIPPAILLRADQVIE